MPSFFFIIHWPGCITLPCSFSISMVLPSKWVIYLLNPNKDSSSVSGMSTYKLSPTLLNVLCFFYLIVNIKSPLAISGTYSASLFLIMVLPLEVPFSTLNVMCWSSLTTRFPRQCSHFASIVYPFPLHFGHSACIYIYIPKPTWTFYKTTP